jgi:glycosyltransferase involved in cell wall biosynthesis
MYSEDGFFMRIAQIAPLYESVPPRLYGGTERVVSYLTEELVKQGHHVTLFCSGDSSSSAEMIPICEKALRFEQRCVDQGSFHFIMAEEVLRNQARFDIIHSHIDYLGFVLSRRTHLPVISTLHGRLDMWEQSFIFREFSDPPLVSISNSQRTPVKFANWISTVYHGVPRDLYTLNENGGDYLVYVGRISPEKRVDSAIAIAIRSGLTLKIAAKVDKADLSYFENEIKHLLDHPLVEFLGEVGDEEKNKLVGSALAFLHPVDWPEPFGLALIEAMACGTPVIARKRGAIPEVVDHGVTGFIFEEDDEAVTYIGDLQTSFSRKACRDQFEKRFLSERMADDYLSVYRSLLDQKAERKIA